MAGRRALHYVLKVGDRPAMLAFLKDTLGMKVLRHEEFDSGCKATCNGPYQNKWSKTMVGYGPESCNFVLEITYNYPIDKYILGNDILGITIGAPSETIEAIKAKGSWETQAGKTFAISPAGYKFYLESSEVVKVREVSLSVSDMSKSLAFWRDLLHMNVVAEGEKESVLNYDNKQASLRLVATDPKGSAVDHAKAYGRIAFSLPSKDLPLLENKVKEAGQGKVKTPLVVLDTPGKADVQVVILEDPDDHEICFVGEEAFDELSKVDPEGDALLEDALVADKSKEWYMKKKLTKEEAQ